MATQKQIEANRRNAERSTGPKTEEGKAKASLNSLKHGMTAETAVLPYEDTVSYDLLRLTLIDNYRPVGAGEEMLVELIANNYWRLLRARRVETASFELHIRSMKARNDLNESPSVDDDMSLAAAFSRHADSLTKLERYQNSIERSYLKAVEALRKAQNDRRRQDKIGSVSQTQPSRVAVTGPVPRLPEIGFVSQPEDLSSNAIPAEPPPSWHTPSYSIDASFPPANASEDLQ
jgi:hypothetical protein